MSNKANTLLVSSDFYSCQGEGKSTGVPAYFIRLGLCNLSCGMSKQFMNQLKKDKKLEDGEIFVGDLQKEGKASWTCDSTSQWLWRGEEKPFQYIIDQWKEQGIYEEIKSGIIHLIWTGGEPTLPRHQEAIVNFTKYWVTQDPKVENKLRQYNIVSFEPYYINRTSGFYEIETNGTIHIEQELFEYLNQINCSPKLSDSGMTAKQRINPDAIKRIMEHSNYQFKFVISTEDDVKEMFRDFVEPFKIPLKNVYCMPGLDNREDFHERTRFVFEMAKKYKFMASSRMHISCWDKTLNV